MMRYTKQADGSWMIPYNMLDQTKNGYTGAAVERLAALENMIEALTAEQQELSENLAKLRAQGRTKTTHFNQLLARKLTIGQMMRTFRSFGAISPADDT